MKNSVSRFDTLANVLFVEHEITPETMALKEDSFKDPAHGYTPEQWMTLPYRKRRYITLRDRVKTGQSNEPKPAIPTQSNKVLPPELDAPESELEPEIDTDTDDVDIPQSSGDEISNADDVTSPAAPEFVDAAVNYVKTNTGTTREQLFKYLSGTFGDRLNTTGEINNVIRQAVQNGDVEFTDSDVAIIPGTNTDVEPSASEIATIDTDKGDERKKDRQRLLKKFLQWRSDRKSGAPIGGEDDEEPVEDDDDDDESPLKRADTVLRKRNYNRISRSGIEDPEAVDVETED